MEEREERKVTAVFLRWCGAGLAASHSAEGSFFTEAPSLTLKAIPKYYTSRMLGFRPRAGG